MGMKETKEKIVAIVLVIAFLAGGLLVTIGGEADATWALILGGVLLAILGPIFYGGYGLIISVISVIALLHIILK